MRNNLQAISKGKPGQFVRVTPNNRFERAKRDALILLVFVILCLIGWWGLKASGAIK